MADKVYALAIHYRGKCKKLKNIDPDKYSYIDFVADIKEVNAVGDETVFKITCTMDDSNATMNICNDFDVLSMFSRNENRVEFDVFVENVEGDSNGEGDEWIDENGEVGGRGSENESDDENISGEDSENESVGDNSGDELSDCKSDDHCDPNNFSDSDFEDDPLHGSLNRDACTLPCETGQKSKEGFKVMRMRKKKRVTAHCSVRDCPWRVHASPLADGVTFQVKTYVPNHTCVRSDPTKEASAEWIASKIESVLRENPGMKARAAIGLDGNNGLFPVAFAVVESECKESWTFFFENLSMLGLVETINEVVPHAINRRCARHIYANFRSQFAGTALKRYFWQAARSYSAAGFNFALYKIKELKPAAYEWLLKIPAEMWCRHAFDPRIKNDHVTNNISESFNHWVGELRSKPILTLVDGLRAKLMSRLQKRKQKGIKWSGLVVPNVVKGLNLVKEESRKCHLLVAGDYEFEVQDENINYIVNLRERTCNCRGWDISGIPCRHAALGISHRREDLDSYCDSRFFKENYMKAYKYCIHSVPDQTFWPHGVDVTPTLLPPIIKRMPGRPKKSRRNEQGEEPNAIRRSNMVKCKVCNELGHNRRTCPNIQVQNSGRDSDLHVSLSKLTRKRKTPPLAGRKRKAAVISSSQPPAPAQVSSSQPLPRKDPVVLSMHAAGSSSQPQPPSYLGAVYLPPSFWRGIGVSPHKEIRSKKHNDAKGANDDETCSQQ
ncbi:hypothetical protein Sango_0257800 [Sesamum angolense]|uniref:SWIM-type domain-containing protein n=1 Tax=Sesamum angolense TaxID=2727404 RepID=A0AAE1XHD4_9LAMI|nr:hypothetical protein Sango_0257800 [Sesamum angolense]